MTGVKEAQKTTGEILRDFFNENGKPVDVAKEMDDILFDWIDSNDQDLQEWHKDKIRTLKCVRDMFTALNSTTDQH